jgi:hypothetical protein
MRQRWVPTALELLENTKVLHPNYEHCRDQLAAACTSILRGELVVLIGPSRVGKSRSVQDALGVRPPIEPDEHEHMRVVMVEAGNDSKGGEFSTKAFMAECLRAIRHPVYGVADEDDPWEERLQAKLFRTPEGTLRAAFRKALELRHTEYLVIDEGHHVRYAPGGDAAAARILDSYKVLASRANIKLVLAGSYQLLELLALAPHLLGRQHPIEFPRYHAESRADVLAWQRILQSFSKCIAFSAGESLCDWNRYLFEGSQGCVGQLLRWLRATLAIQMSEGAPCLTRQSLEGARTPAAQELAILAEIVAGEQHLLRIANAVAGERQRGVASTSSATKSTQEKESKKRKRKPFQRKSRRNKVGGRV